MSLKENTLVKVKPGFIPEELIRTTVVKKINPNNTVTCVWAGDDVRMRDRTIPISWVERVYVHE